MEWAKRENWKILFALLHNLLTTGNLPRLIWSLKPGFIRPDIFHTCMDRNRKPLVLSPWLSTDNHKMIQSDLLWWFKEVDYKFHQFVQHILEAMSFTTAIKAYIKKGLISYSLTQLKENVSYILIISELLFSRFHPILIKCYHLINHLEKVNSLALMSVLILVFQEKIS